MNGHDVHAVALPLKNKQKQECLRPPRRSTTRKEFMEGNEVMGMSRGACIKGVKNEGGKKLWTY